MVDWSTKKKLTMNKNKTKVEVRLLGFILSSSLSWSYQVDSILVAASQGLYLLNQLRHMSLDIVGLSNVFRSLVVSKMLYALPAISGSLNQSDKTRLDALLRKAKRWGLTDMTETFGDPSDNADEHLFRSLQFEVVRWSFLLPENMH